MVVTIVVTITTSLWRSPLLGVCAILNWTSNVIFCDFFVKFQHASFLLIAQTKQNNFKQIQQEPQFCAYICQVQFKDLK